jgi:hypothetical protein
MKSISIASLSATFLLLLALSGCVAATVPIKVQNDLDYAVSLTLCDDDPVDVDQRQTVTVHPLVTQSHVACLVYRVDGSSYVGCLALPTGQQTGDQVRLSKMNTTTSESDCARKAG